MIYDITIALVLLVSAVLQFIILDELTQIKKRISNLEIDKIYTDVTRNR